MVCASSGVQGPQGIQGEPCSDTSTWVTDETELRAVIDGITDGCAQITIAQEIAIAADLTIPDTVNLKFLRCGILSPESGVTLTVNSTIDAGLWQIFGGNGATTGTPNIPCVYPEWFGAIGDGVADDYTPCQKALAFPSVEFPAGKTYRIVNASYAAGADMFEQRADAVANNTLYPLTAALDGQRIVVNGTIQATSELGDLLQVSGDGASVTGTGKIEGNGVVNDYNSGQIGGIPENQWLATLLLMSGDDCSCSGIHFDTCSTVNVRLTGPRARVENITILGGLTAHGTGTALFGVYVAVTAVNSVISDSVFAQNASGESVYTGVFALASYNAITGNAFSNLLEHAVYAYGDYMTVSGNNIDTTASGGIQLINAAGAVITGNLLKDTAGGVALNSSSEVNINGNNIIGCTSSGVSLRTYVGATSETPAQKDIVISDNVIECTGNQRPIDIAISEGMENFTITGNVCSYTGADENSYGAFRIDALSTYPSRTLMYGVISNNTINQCPSRAMVFNRVSKCVVSGNVIKNPCTDLGSASAAVIVAATCSDITFANNILSDDRGTSLTSLFVNADTGATGILANNNLMYGVTAPSGYWMTTRNNPVRGCSLDGDQACGSIMTTATASAQITNALCKNNSYQTVLLYPMNKAAHTMQRGASALYTTVSDGYFTIITADGNAATANAEYMYEIVTG